MTLNLETRASESASLEAFLALVEKHGSVVLGSRNLEKKIPLVARAALHAVHVLAGAEAAASWPCDVRGCAREIRANYTGARKPLVAICCQAPAACMPIELGFDDVSQQSISVAPLVCRACTLLGANVDDDALATLNERHPIGIAPPPVLVATSRKGARDLFWARTPRDTDLAAFCARRERVKRRTLVLVPTGRHVSLELAARYASGERVEVLALTDALEIRDGEIALRETRESPAPRVSTSAPSATGRATDLAALLGVTRWEDIRLIPVDDQTLRIEAKGQTLLRSFAELGFVDGRTKDARPVSGWHLLLLLCHKGVLRPSEYAEFGKKWGAKKGIEEMRKRLCAAFGLAEDPLLTYLSRKGWRPRFRVAPTRG